MGLEGGGGGGGGGEGDIKKCNNIQLRLSKKCFCYKLKT